VDAISPASLSMPLTYYIVSSSCGSPKFQSSLIKPELPNCFSLPEQSGKGGKCLDLTRKIRTIARAGLLLSRNNGARFIQRRECAIGKFFQRRRNAENAPTERRIFGTGREGERKGASQGKRDNFRDIAIQQNSMKSITM
jgi:hypothetical protein